MRPHRQNLPPSQGGTPPSGRGRLRGPAPQGYVPIPPEVRTYYLYATAQYRFTFTNAEMVSALQLGSRPYVLGRPLGQGSYGTVYVGIRADQINSQNQDRLAIKLSKPTNPLMIPALARELNIVDRLIQSPHPNVIRFVERFATHNNALTYIVMELATDDLLTMVHVMRQGQPIWKAVQPQYARHLIRGIAQGLHHLFSLGISHGDLKLENVLINYRSGVTQNRNYFNMIPKLTDFNNSKMEAPGVPILVNQKRCTTYSAAPESLANIVYDMRNADIYSLGICLLALLIACHPFKDPHPQADQFSFAIQFERSRTLKQNRVFITALVSPFDNRLRQLLTRTLEPQPETRISIDEFLASDWVAQRVVSQEVERHVHLGQVKLPQEQPIQRRGSN